jgi:hypothetical protein
LFANECFVVPAKEILLPQFSRTYCLAWNVLLLDEQSNQIFEMSDDIADKGA